MDEASRGSARRGGEEAVSHEGGRESGGLVAQEPEWPALTR
jgi:hypothetical protein